LGHDSEKHSATAHSRYVSLNVFIDSSRGTGLTQLHPGYTIVDSPILFNGSVYIVTDDFVSIPPIESIMSPQEGSNERDWKVISGREATKLFGSYGGK
jgi:hypothetical protein